mgnify:CR=1 FL=1
MLRNITLRGNSILLFAGILVALTGCGKRGPKLVDVSGTVTLDGQPLGNVIVTFVPVEGGVSSSGVTDEAGHFRLSCSLGRGALVGQHRVYVQSQAAGPEDVIIPDEDAPDYRPDPYASLRAPPFVEKIPARYNTHTELVQEVRPGVTVNLDLTSRP